MDAQEWLRRHAKLTLEVPDPAAAPLAWRVRLVTDRPLPAAFRAPVSLFVDGAGPIGPAGTLEAPAGAPADRAFDVDAKAVPGLLARLNPGTHAVFARAASDEGAWKGTVLDSPPIEVVVTPPKDPSSPPPPPPPPPRPPPPPPPPSPEGDRGGGPRPAAGLEDEVVTPLVRDGPRVEKDQALVAVRDPNAGASPPRAVPIEEALRDFDRVVERAVGGERVLPSDREFVRRYLEALRRAVAVPGR
jgi:hypothetical protein